MKGNSTGARWIFALHCLTRDRVLVNPKSEAPKSETNPKFKTPEMFKTTVPTLFGTFRIGILNLFRFVHVKSPAKWLQFSFIRGILEIRGNF
jgi:hypothetical protein